LVLCAKKNLATLFSSRNGDVNQKYPSASWWLPSITAWLQITGSPRSVELRGPTEPLRHKDLLKRSE
jgi:hypothetical protein